MGARNQVETLEKESRNSSSDAHRNNKNWKRFHRSEQNIFSFLFLFNKAIKKFKYSTESTDLILCAFQKNNHLMILYTVLRA
jgi:hypothetical protein